MEENNTNQTVPPVQEQVVNPMAGQPTTTTPMSPPITQVPAPETQMPSSTPTTPQKKSSNKSMLIAINAVIIIVVILAGLYVLALKGSQKGISTSSVVTKPTQITPTATPTPTTIKPEENIDPQTIDTGDPAADIQSINADLQQL